MESAQQAAELDWSGIDPSILGTLFERGLDPDKRSQLGSHYTDRDKIMLLVKPLITRPLLGEWDRAKTQIESLLSKGSSTSSTPAATNMKRKAVATLNAFLVRLRSFTVLDPACGSGNFLYVALQELKDIEHRVQLDAEGLGLERGFPRVGPDNVRGIEINPFAAELARISVWIGEIQWMRRHGFSEDRDPILRPLKTIKCRDSILSPANSGPDWPDSDVIIGNPPFLGGKLLLGLLGEDYVTRLRSVYEANIPAFSDLVCYWFYHAGQLLKKGKIARFGLVFTNSIRGGKNRYVLDRIVENAMIFDAWSDEPWVVEGATVRVSLICFCAAGSDLEVRLNGINTDRIATDLTSDTADLTAVTKLIQNRGISLVGNQKSGPFDISGALAREWLRLPRNPNGRPNSDVLRPWCNGMDVVRRPSGKWIIDFGMTMSDKEAARYERPYSYVEKKVLPMRQRSRVKGALDAWWRHWCPRPRMLQALAGKTRFIATPTLSKYRLFVWLDVAICPDHQLIVIARDDDTTFGILHSRFHEAWSLRLGASLEDRPRYTPTTTLLTFPFPNGLSPNLPAAAHAQDSRATAIAASTRRLVELRDRWLNPPEWVKWVEEPAPGYPKRPVPRSEAAADQLKERTLTNLYNQRPRWLADAHDSLDSAVASAYGWDERISEADALAALLELNRSRSAGIAWAGSR